ncbi:hypothetical protein [uncultured Microbulbifer sp.]|uniref:hypothetical protein n=1 Tax=uncultured Microbulbifer sp. TaxID=348147 RepID=UPI0026102233|nr:hypothetical protein [uncultured Microbulbifer sp.]
MKQYTERSIISLIFILVFSLGNTAAFSTDHDDSEIVLPVYNSEECNQGFFRPPGIRECVNLQDLLSPNPPVEAPEGACPEFWQRYDQGGFCLPSHSVVSCGSTYFSCNNSQSDKLWLVPGYIGCPEPSQVIVGKYPSHNRTGELFLTYRPVFLCQALGPPERTDPL